MAKTIKLADGAVVKYYKDFMDNNASQELYQSLINDVPWQHGVYKMFGKNVNTPRILYAMRDEDTDIRNVYTVTPSMVWTDSMRNLKKLVEQTTGKTFRYAQLNYYRDGKDYIGYHTDSEVQKGDIIASISLGAPRKFMFRHIKYKENNKKYDMVLENGSLLVMNEQAAKLHWKHSLPKSTKTLDGRINITFRPN